MVQFTEDHRATYGVEPMCHAIGMAPSTFCKQRARRRDPACVPARTLREVQLRQEITRCWHENQCVYGATNVWKQLNREGLRVARSTVARVMKAAGPARGRA